MKWQLISVILNLTMLMIIAIQVYLIWKQLKADHERSRREKAVDLLLKWTEQLDAKTSIARKIGERLSFDETRKIFNYEKIKLSKDYGSLLSKIFKDEDLKKDGNYIELSEFQVAKLRWLIISYLNLLESILTAWQYSIVDRNLIEHEFSYLFSPEEGNSALKNFRIISGGEKAYPAIEVFISYLEDKRKEILQQKREII